VKIEKRGFRVACVFLVQNHQNSHSMPLHKIQDWSGIES
jgi:hypothetical protein